MKKQISRAFRFGLITGLSLAVFAGTADAAKMSGKQCRQDWRAHKAMYKSEGKSRRSFMKECRSGNMQPTQTAPSTTSH